jgi:hypothetical protein
MEESGNVYVFEGKAYSGCEELLGVLRRTLGKLR